MRASVAEKAAAIIASSYAAEIGDISAGAMTVEDTKGRKYRVKGIHPRRLIGLVANELYKRLVPTRSNRLEWNKEDEKRFRAKQRKLGRSSK